MSNTNRIGAPTIPTQSLQSTPVTILYKLSNPFSSPLPVPRGGTGIGTFSPGDILYGSGSVLANLPLGTNGQVLMCDSTKPYWSNDLNDINASLDSITGQQTNTVNILTTLGTTSGEYITRLTNVSDSITTEAQSINALIIQSSNQDQEILNARTQLQVLETSLVGVNDLTTSIQTEDAKTTAIESKLSNINTQIDSVTSSILQAQDNIAHLSSNINSYGMFKNKIVNGSFGVWQRGESYIGLMPTGSSVAYLTADRWCVAAGSNTTIVMQRTTGLIGTGLSTRKAVDALHLSFSGAGNKTLRHNIENARTLQGQQCTISFWAKGPSFTLTLQLKQMFGASSNTVFSTTFNITETYQQFSYTFTMPVPPANTVMGPNNCIQLNFMSSLNWSVDIASIQLEQGPLSTFEYRPPVMILLLCQRFYESGLAYLLGYVYQNTTPYVNCIFKSDKRVVPSIKTTVLNNSSFTTSVVVANVSTQQVTLGCTKNAYSTDGSFNIQWTADSELYV
jgi:hypothetical protein